MKSIKISEKVYSKDFQVNALGYDAHEVDSFLDEVNQNIVALERRLEELEQANERLESEKLAYSAKINSLTIDNNKLKAQNGVNSNSGSNFNNIDLIERIANLERMVQALVEKMNK